MTRLQKSAVAEEVGSVGLLAHVPCPCSVSDTEQAGGSHGKEEHTTASEAKGNKVLVDFLRRNLLSTVGAPNPWVLPPWIWSTMDRKIYSRKFQKTKLEFAMCSEYCTEST